MRSGTIILLAACSGLLAACGGGAQENTAANIDENAGVLADNGVLPMDELPGNDTLGNDVGMNDMTDMNATGETENTTNSY